MHKKLQSSITCRQSTFHPQCRSDRIQPSRRVDRVITTYRYLCFDPTEVNHRQYKTEGSSVSQRTRFNSIVTVPPLAIPLGCLDLSKPPNCDKSGQDSKPPPSPHPRSDTSGLDWARRHSDYLEPIDSSNISD